MFIENVHSEQVVRRIAEAIKIPIDASFVFLIERIPVVPPVRERQRKARWNCVEKAYVRLISYEIVRGEYGIGIDISTSRRQKRGMDSTEYSNERADKYLVRTIGFKRENWAVASAFSQEEQICSCRRILKCILADLIPEGFFKIQSFQLHF